jgi:hypothetical protein
VFKEEFVIRKTKLILAAGIVLAVGVSGIAFGDAENQTSTVTGKVTNKKQPKRQYKPASLFTGVTTLSDNNDPVIPSAPSEQVFIDFDDDIKISFRGIPVCNATLNGTTTQEARALCPRSVISRPPGKAKARIPAFPAPNNEVSDFVVTAFRGPGNQLILHAFSATLTDANTQVVLGRIVNSPAGGDFGKRLAVNDVPDAAGDAGALVAFNATIKRGGVIKARCHDGNKTWNFRAQFNYESADGTDTATDRVSDTHKCTVKRTRR